MKNLKIQYDLLEKKVIETLLNAVYQSEYTSKHINEKAIKVELFDYTELTVVNNELVFLDNGGYQYTMYAECSLEDLIDILPEEEKKLDRYEKALKECKLVRGVSSVEEKERLEAKYGQPDVVIPEFLSEWRKSPNYFDPFNEKIEYWEDETGRYEKPCFWNLGWK